MVPVHATKAYWGEEAQLHAFLMTLNGGQKAALHTGLFTVEKESPEPTEQEDEWAPASVLMLRRGYSASLKQGRFGPATTRHGR